MNTADASTATKIWRWNLSGLGYSSTGYNGPYKTAITQDGHIVADFIDTGTLTANIIKAGIMQSVNGQFSFNLETGHITAQDADLTGVFCVNGSEYDLKIINTTWSATAGAQTQPALGLERERGTTKSGFIGFTDGTAAVGGLTYDVRIDSTKGVRIDSGDAFTDVVCKEDRGFRVRSAEDNLGLYSSYFTATKDKVETSGTFVSNWSGDGTEFEGLIHHRTVGGSKFKLGVGIAKMNAEKTPGAGLEIRSETNDMLWAGLYAWTELDNVVRLTFQTQNQDGTTYSKTLTANGEFLYFNGRRLKFADEET